MRENALKCRLCLKTDNFNSNIDRKLSEAIKILFEIDLEESHVPSIICLKCTKIVSDFYEYYCDVKSNQNKFLKIYETEEITIKKEDSSDISDTEIQFEDENFDSESRDDSTKPIVEPKIEIREVTSQIDDCKKLLQYSCDICGNEFRTYTYLKRHIHLKHLRKYDVGCKICGKGLYDTTSLKRHIDSVHKNIKQPPRRTQCPHCGVTIANLSSHLKFKHPLLRGLKGRSENDVKTLPATPEIYICDLCSSTFVRKLYLRKHLLQKHLNIFEDKCPQCQKGFYDKTAVKRHIKEHHMSVRPPPKRSICIKCGKYVTAIQLHMRRVHNANKPETKPKRILPKVECPICKKMISSRQDNINEHNRRVHGANIPKKVKQKKGIGNLN
ncbi:zinc finger Y-chromosomal protein-like [Culicoides brevitarsis]|uniref:zinc finger Y-chromosomal protein-like n=1 Tax=Culicoides brevitarsis TaxID=469753 RepID=UPI00307CBC3C